METIQTTQRIHPDAPPIIHELRRLFDERSDDLYRVALDHAVQKDHGASPMYHIDFPAGALHVTAMFNFERSCFTQLVARAADEAHHERPSFTISLFL
ncbi:MAG: hypothetical protein WAU70_11385 [Flavobacteriales bacterium]